MPRPAQELLKAGCQEKPAWAVFDRGWYLHHYPEARAHCEGKEQDFALHYYLHIGARQGHSPSALFDEIYYLEANPDVAELVRTGYYASGFDHYCQHGWRGVSPHWLFNDSLYAELYDDMSLENLELHGCFGRYDHFLKSGQRERRVGHFLFDGQFYRSQALAAGVTEGQIDGPGPYAHYLSCLGSGMDELPPSIYFDPGWYIAYHPRAKEDVLRGQYVAAIHHYLTNKIPELFNPVPQFSERFYRQHYPDIAAAIGLGMYRNAYQQFVQYGCYELRQPCAEIDLAYYRDMHRQVRDDLNSGLVRDGFAHLRLTGLRQGLVYTRPKAMPALEEYPAREAFFRKAQSNIVLFSKHKLSFFYKQKPKISVIMVAHNRFELTMRSLASLRQNFSGPVQLVLVDNGSSDATRHIEDFLPGAEIIRNTENLGFLKGCNQALEKVSASALLYLNNDVELGFGAVEAALTRLKSDETIGAVCGKVIRTHGRLQEAGSIIWDDGTAAGYLRDASPLAAEANFVREVDFGSAVFLLCQTNLVKQLAGFDEDFMPAYYEDADLCVRIIEAGYKIIYDPAVSLEHLEFGSAATSEVSMALMRRGKRIFKSKHSEFLRHQFSASEQNILRARARGGRKRVLYIEDTIPLRRLGSGFVRSNDIVCAIDASGYDVHVFPANGAPYDVMSLFGGLPEQVEILCGEDITRLESFLEERTGVYDLLWVARTHNLRRVQEALAKADYKMPVVLDSEALVSCRLASEAALNQAKFDLPSAVRQEFSGLMEPKTILAVNEMEASLLSAAGCKSVRVLGTARAGAAGPAMFKRRDGLLFLGAIHQAGAPNEDALRYYAEHIQPALARLMPQAPMLRAAGHLADGVEPPEFEGRMEWLGEIIDTAPLYIQSRLFIAPTRIAAGTPYKIYEAAAMGLPCVVTDLLAAQLGWRDGEEVLAVPVDQPQAFAEAIARLYSDEALWQKLREAALNRLKVENNPALFSDQVKRILAESLKH